MKKNKRKQKAPKKKVGYYRKPEDMSIEDWQRALREQYGQSKDFEIKNIGEHKFFSDFIVSNPRTKTSYKVAIRDERFSQNFCACADFRINRLGTCKHIEAVKFYLVNKRGYKTAMKRGWQSPYSSIYLDYKDELCVRLKIGSEQESAVKSLAKPYFTKEFKLKKRAQRSIEQFVQALKHEAVDLRIYPDALDYLYNLRSDAARKRKVDQLITDEGKLEILDTYVKANLYPYQRKGVYFAINSGRCILADDMGLGKTIQSIVVSEFYFKHLKTQKTIVICPTSLKTQWKNEINKFTDSDVHIVEGSIHKRKIQYQKNVRYCIVSYGMARNDIAWINDGEFDLVILDEAQRIKNWNTKTARAFKQINTTYALALSGTPVQNKLQELYSVMQFIDIHALGPLHHYISRHTLRDEMGKVIGYQKLDEIGSLLKNRLIRRTKDQVLKDLPERIDMNRFVEMKPEQRDYYDEYKAAVAKLIFKWRRMGFLSEKDRQLLLNKMSCMRMICDSTYILDQENRHDTKVDEIMDLMKEIIDASDEKIIIFSEWVRMHHLIIEELEKAGIDYEFLHGSVPSNKRGELIDRFKSNPLKRIFLSTDAGGLGLNLQEASVVINVDLPWNPAVLEQRIGRVYRLGQKRSIRVINLIALDSIEFKMLDRLRFKSEMAAGILDGGVSDVFLNEEEVAGIVNTIANTLELDEDSDREGMADKVFDGVSIMEHEEDLEAKPSTNNVEEIVMEDESLSDEIKSDGQSEPVPQSSNEQNDKMAQVMNQGMQFLSGMMEMMTGGKASFSNQKIEIDEKTGEFVMRFKIDQ